MAMVVHVLGFGGPGNGWGIFVAILIGLVCAAIVGEVAGRRAARRDRDAGVGRGESAPSGQE